LNNTAKPDFLATVYVAGRGYPAVLQTLLSVHCTPTVLMSLNKPTW